MSPESGLKVLITNLEMNERSGTVTYVRDLALCLQRMGHRPMVFSPRLGAVAQELITATVPVVDDLAKIGVEPDIIHGHHHVETMMALTHFSRTPAIFVCHDWMAWHDVPPRFPRILRYCAVDHTCLDKLVAMSGIAESTTRVLFNAVDLDRFQPRAALPAKPRRAAVFTNYRYNVRPLREACAQLGIALDEIGAASGTPVDAPEQVLPAYDLVFAKARAAMEAMAVGCAVVVCDYRGLAGLVTTENFSQLRRLNFGARSLRHAHDVASLVREIQGYDPAEATRVSAMMRRVGGLDALAADLVDLYEEVIASHARHPGSAADEGIAIAGYLRDWSFSRGLEMERGQVEGGGLRGGLRRHLPPALLALMRRVRAAAGGALGLGTP
jgi:glycosyltransferase involved in cell wall biosynthesis